MSKAVQALVDEINLREVVLGISFGGGERVFQFAGVEDGS